MAEDKKIRTAFRALLCVVVLSVSSVRADAQRRELVPFGDFEQWTVRQIKESDIIGGASRTLYVIAPTDTIRQNAAFDYSNTIWASSNAYAVVMGITKTSCSVTPDKGPDGLCARLESCYASVKVAGIVDVKVFAGGSVYWGKMLEPIKGVSKPYSNMDWGIPFTGRPGALVLDYKSVLPNTGKIVRGRKEVDGYDPEEIMLILQNRREDADGRLHVKRVGTAAIRIERSSGKWVKDKVIPVIYGDATKDSSYRDYMGLTDFLYAVNSKGKCVTAPEEGWAEPWTPVTHALLSISSGSCHGFDGAVGNILWVDNIRLEYE